MKTFLEDKLRKSFFNNFQKRYKNLPKNKKSYEHFENTHQSWLNNNLHFHFDANTPNDTVKSGYILSLTYFFIYLKISMYKKISKMQSENLLKTLSQ